MKLIDNVAQIMPSKIQTYTNHVLYISADYTHHMYHSCKFLSCPRALEDCTRLGSEVQQCYLGIIRLIALHM
jgi:hypothetical protein